MRHKRGEKRQEGRRLLLLEHTTELRRAEGKTLKQNVKKVTQERLSLIRANSLRHETVSGIYQVRCGIMRFLQSEFTSRKDQVKLTFSNFKGRNSKTSNS